MLGKCSATELRPQTQDLFLKSEISVETLYVGVCSGFIHDCWDSEAVEKPLGRQVASGAVQHQDGGRVGAVEE